MEDIAEEDGAWIIIKTLVEEAVEEWTEEEDG